MKKSRLNRMVFVAVLLPFLSVAKSMSPSVNVSTPMKSPKQPAANQTATRSVDAPSQVTTIAFYLQEGVEVLDFAGPLEVFTYAGFRVFTVSKTKAPITSQGVLKVTPDYSIEDAPRADIIAVFGGNVTPVTKDPAVISWIQQQQATAKYFFSVCTGAFLLAHAGLLDGLTVTTFHASIQTLRKDFPKAKVLDNVRFVDNGKIITTAGISAGIDGALQLVTKLRGDATTKQVVSYMEYDKWKAGEGLILSQ